MSRPHIIYLLKPFWSEATSRFKTQITTGRRTSEYEDDAAQLHIFSIILFKLEKDITYDALYARLPFTWRGAEPYDIVNPFGDFRQLDIKALWTFDLQNDVLFHTNRHRRAQMPLDVLRNRSVTLGDMESLGPPVPPVLHLTLDPAMPYWTPQVQVNRRHRAFIHRILRDFDYQWRHILRNNYNIATLRVLARAIIRLSTLDFEIREETGWPYGRGDRWVDVTELPVWKPFGSDIVLIGDVHVVVCYSIQDGISKAKKHIASHQFVAAHETVDRTRERPDYIILSVKHIVLCRAIGLHQLEHTAPEPLFNGDRDAEPPSKLALDYLLWAVTPAIKIVDTRLLLMPIEIQDTILHFASAGPVAAAKIGCLLGLGTPFLWKDGLRRVILEDVRGNRDHRLPTESQLWFSDSSAGITYMEM